LTSAFAAEKLRSVFACGGKITIATAAHRIEPQNSMPAEDKLIATVDKKKPTDSSHHDLDIL